jgi:hypothetical protein
MMHRSTVDVAGNGLNIWLVDTVFVKNPTTLAWDMSG